MLRRYVRPAVIEPSTMPRHNNLMTRLWRGEKICAIPSHSPLSERGSSAASESPVPRPYRLTHLGSAPFRGSCARISRHATAGLCDHKARMSCINVKHVLHG